MKRRPAQRPAVRLPGAFGWLISAWSVSLIGDGFRMIGLPLLAYSISPKASAVATVAAFGALPWLLIAVPAGALVDRMPAGRVLILADCARALVSLVLVGLIMRSMITIALLSLVGFLLTAAETFADGAGQTLMVRVVPVVQLDRANSRFAIAQTIALDLLGPLGAGFCFLVSPGLPFEISAVVYAVSAGLTLVLGRKYRQIWGSTDAPAGRDLQSLPAGRWGGRVAEFFRMIAAGLRRLWTDPILRTLVITVAVLSTANAAIDGVLVVYAKMSLGLSSAGYPTLLVAYSVGILISAAIVPRLQNRVPSGRMMMTAMAGLGGTMLLLGLIVRPIVALAAYGLMGVAGGTWNVLSATRRQRLTPRGMVARVSSAFRVIAFGVIPIGTLAGGQLGQHEGVPTVFTAAGVLVLIMLLAVVRPFLSSDRPTTADQAGAGATAPKTP